MAKYIARIGKNCVACGSCVPVCPKQALSVPHGVRAMVDQSLCIGCGLCVKECPAGIIEKVLRNENEKMV